MALGYAPLKNLQPPETISTNRGIEAIDRTEKAVVFLTVEWSGPERASRKEFQEAIELLRHISGVSVFFVAEDADEIASWVQARTGYTHPAGAGSVMWLERGRLIKLVSHAAPLGAEGIVATTHTVWGSVR